MSCESCWGAPGCENCEELRQRAESAESRIASVSGVTREELAKREYERGLAEGKALREELRAALAGIIEIGKRDLSNPKYDGYFEEARSAIAKAEVKP